MANITTKDMLLQKVSQARHEPGYPTAVRMVAGTYHAVIAFASFVGAITMIGGQDMYVGAAQVAGMGIEGSSAFGYGAVLIGALALGIGLLHGWAGLGLFIARQQAYYYILLINGCWLALSLLGFRPMLSVIVQILVSSLIVILMVFDPRIMAVFGRGPLAESQRQITDQSPS